MSPPSFKARCRNLGLLHILTTHLLPFIVALGSLAGHVGVLAAGHPDQQHHQRWQTLLTLSLKITYHACQLRMLKHHLITRLLSSPCDSHWQSSAAALCHHGGGGVQWTPLMMNFFCCCKHIIVWFSGLISLIPWKGFLGLVDGWMGGLLVCVGEGR